MSKITYDRGYWSNGQLQSETPFVNGELHGLEQWWWMNGQLKSETSYVNGKEHGLVKWYNPSGELTDTDLYNNGTHLMELISTPIHSTKKIKLI